MNTIESLKEEKTFYKKERHPAGTVIEIPYQKMVPLQIKSVTPGTRFAYFLLDLLCIYFVNAILGIFLFSTGNFYVGDELTFRVISSIMFFLFYFLMEVSMGTTPGKLIAGYTVIDKFARRPSAGTIVLRSLCRLIPFEALSCLGSRGWHDSLSKTWVVKKSEMLRLQGLLGAVSEDDILDQSFVAN